MSNTTTTTHWDPKDLLEFQGRHQQDGVVHVPGLVASDAMAELLTWVDDISNASTLGRHYFERQTVAGSKHEPKTSPRITLPCISS